jgi:hypothetical protein
MPKFKGRKATKREMGRKGQTHSGRLGGISKPLMNRKGRRP